MHRLRSAKSMIGAVDEQQYRPTLIQVVARRTAEPDGVTDYALALARALRAYKGANSVFLSGTPSVDAMPVEDDWKTVCVPKRKAQILADTIQLLSAETNARAVVLHFSGYGYQKRGVPLWLVQGLQIWSRRAGRVPLLTIFHELYATGRPWQSAFWLSPLQKQIARSILKSEFGSNYPDRPRQQTPVGLARRGCHQNHGDARVLQCGGAGLWLCPLRTKCCCRCVRARRGRRWYFWHLSFKNRTHHFSSGDRENIRCWAALVLNAPHFGRRACNFEGSFTASCCVRAASARQVWLCRVPSGFDRQIRRLCGLCRTWCRSDCALG